MMLKLEQNGLIQIKDPKIIFNIINKSKLSDSDVYAWKMVGSSKLTAEIKIRLIRKFRNEIELIPHNNSKAKLDQIVSSSEEINIFIPDHGVLFQSRIRFYGVAKSNYSDALVLKISLPSMLAQVDRRKSIRVVIPEEVQANVSFSLKGDINALTERQFSKRCIDISAGGVSFMISKAEKSFFEIDSTLNKLQLTLDGEKISLTGKVVNIMPIEPDEDAKILYAVLKIGVEFTNPSRDIVRTINSFVFKYASLSEATPPKPESN